MPRSDKQRNLFSTSPEEIPDESFSHELTADEAYDPELSKEEAARELAKAKALAAATEKAEAPQPERLDDWTIYVVDSNSLIFQVFYALPDMTSPSGEHVSAVYGFAKDMLYLIEQKKPTAIICAFDLPGPTFRHELFDGYKVDRAEMPAELGPQFPKIVRLLEALAIPALSVEGFEADDVLATVVHRAEALGAKCFVVTADKDCRQLITEKVKMFDIRKNRIFDEVALQETWGIRPDQVVDFQALVGDKVDCVPGVPLIGPKNAAELLNAHGDLNAVLDAAPEMKKGKRRENLIEFREQAILSRLLVELNREIPMEINWSGARVGEFNAEMLGDLSREFGFRGLGEQLLKLAGADSVSTPRAEAKWEINYETIDTEAKLADLVQTLASQKEISVDTETTHLSPRWADIVGISFAWGVGKACYVPLMGPAGEVKLDPTIALEALRPILENPSIQKIGQNLKYDSIVFRGAGIELQGIHFDTMIASYLLEAGERNHNLDDLSARYLGHTTIKIDELIGKGKNQKRMDEVPVANVAEYAAEDADVPLRLKSILAARLEKEGLSTLNQDVETPLLEVLAEMEFNGICVDVKRLEALSERFGKRVDTLAEEIEIIAGHPLNINSPKQMAEVLFQELGLPVIKKTKTGPSTDVSVLEELASLHPLPAKVIEFRQFTKLKNTYVDALPAMVCPKTGRVHTSFNQVVAATGRLSSNEPNLQNIPIRTSEGRDIRSAFVVEKPGSKLLTADYSQIELRILAHYSNDEAMCSAFERDQDIHTLVASQVYGIPLDQVDAQQRRSAKAVNFGIIYGQTAFGLAKSLAIPKEEAAAFIDAYFTKYPGVDRFFTETLDICREQGGVQTILGRRRAIANIRDANKLSVRDGRYSSRMLNFDERTAVNTVIQGSAADLIKLAMLELHRELKSQACEAKLLLQIHDELVLEAPEGEIDNLRTMVVDCMTRVMDLSVPLKVDVKIGVNWAECE